jgi:hypothetical protein
VQGITTRRNQKAAASNAPTGGGGRSGGASKPNIKKATFDTTKKKEVGVSDLTLLSKVSNEAINENLQKRFENREIYVRTTAWREDQAAPPSRRGPVLTNPSRHTLDMCLFPSTLFGTVRGAWRLAGQ